MDSNCGQTLRTAFVTSHYHTTLILTLQWSYHSFYSLLFVSTVFWEPCSILWWMSILYYLPFAFSSSFSSLVNHSLHQVTTWNYIFSHSYIFWYNLKNVVFIMTPVQPFLIICPSHMEPFLLMSITTVGFSYDSFISLSVPLFSNPHAPLQVHTHSSEWNVLLKTPVSLSSFQLPWSLNICFLDSC